MSSPDTTRCSMHQCPRMGVHWDGDGYYCDRCHKNIVDALRKRIRTSDRIRREYEWAVAFRFAATRLPQVLARCRNPFICADIDADVAQGEVCHSPGYDDHGGHGMAGFYYDSTGFKYHRREK